MLQSKVQNIFNNKLNDNSWIQIILIVQGCFYPISGIYNCFVIHIESTQLYYTRVALGILTLAVGIGSYYNVFLKKKLLDLFIAIALLYNIHSLLVGIYNKFNTGQTTNILLMQIVTLFLIQNRKQLVIIASLFFLATSTCIIFYAPSDTTVFLLIKVMFISIVISTIMNFGRIRMIENDKFNYSLFKTIFNTSSDAILIVNPANTEILECNDRAVSLFEAKTKDDLIGKNGIALRSNPINKERLMYIQEQLKEGKIWIEDVEYTTFKNKTFWGNISVSMFNINEDALVQLCIADITELKELSDKYKRREEIFSTIYNESSDAIIIFNKIDNSIVDCNSSAVAMFEYESKEDFLILNGLDLRLNRLSQQELDDIKTKINQNKQHGDEVVYITKSGRTFWGAYTSKYIKIDNADRVLVRITDISNIKEKEKIIEENQKHLNEVQKLAKIGSYVYDLRNSKIVWSEGLYEIFGINSNLSIDSNVTKDIVHPDDKVRVTERFEMALQTEKELVQQYRAKKKDDTFIFVNSIAKIYRNENNIPYKVTGLIQDISEQKRTEEILLANELAKKTAEMKDQFLTNMSHEIRTPLNAVLGFSNLLQNSINIKEKEKDYIDGIRLNSSHLLLLINNILNISKLESVKIELEIVDFDLRTLLKELQNSQLFFIHEKGIAFHLIIDEKLPPIIQTDKVKLNQILLNLFSNAIKFTNKGSIEIALLVKQEYESALDLLFSVKDTGIGIPTDKMDLIFEKFTQVNNTNSRELGGTGLGLSIVKRLVEMLGGSITVKSEVGIETEFSFIVKVNKSNSLIQQLPVSPIDNLELRDLEINILLVEDNHFNQIVVFDTLIEWNKNLLIDIAENGKEAIAYLSKNKKYDLILLDIQMPVMDGYETSRYIRNQMSAGIKNIPIVAMTAHALPGVVEKCMQAGIDDYITKPFTPSLLFEKINKYILRHDNENSDKPIRVDFEKIKNVSSNTTTRMKNRIAAFLKDTPQEINAIKLAGENSDWVVLADLCHAILPTYLYMGLPHLLDRLKTIELISRKQVELEKLPLLIDELSKEFQLAYSELQTFYNSIN